MSDRSFKLFNLNLNLKFKSELHRKVTKNQINGFIDRFLDFKLNSTG